MAKILTLLGMLLSVSPGLASGSAVSCQSDSATILFANGINTLYLDAVKSADNLLQALVPGNQPCLTGAVAWDSTYINSTDPQLTWINQAFQLVDAVQQKGVDLSTGTFWGWWNHTVFPAPPWFQEIVDKIETTPLLLNRPNLSVDLFQLQQLITSKNKVIAVAHSQGNLYINECYTLLKPAFGPLNMAIVAVASPADAVADGGPHFTLQHDVILEINEALHLPQLPANMTNDAPSPCLGTDPDRSACHQFDQSYMGFGDPTQADQTRPAILSAIVAALPGDLGALNLRISAGDQSALSGQVLRVTLPPTLSGVTVTATTTSGGDLSIDGIPVFSLEQNDAYSFQLLVGTHTVSLVLKGVQVQVTVVVSSASLTIITFDQPYNESIPTGSLITVATQGYVFAGVSEPGDLGGGLVVVNCQTNMYVCNGSSALGISNTSGSLTMTRSDGLPFQLLGFSAAPLYVNSAFNATNLTVTLTLEDGTIMSELFSLMPGTFTTYAMPGSSVTSVRFNGSNSNFPGPLTQPFLLDNIIVQ